MRLSAIELEMVLRSMHFVSAGEWPWTANQDGTPDKVEKRERAAFDRAYAKLERREAAIKERKKCPQQSK